MEPVTAALNAFAAFNNFLATTEGQKVAADNRALILNVLGKLHLKVAPDTTAPAVHA